MDKNIVISTDMSEEKIFLEPNQMIELTRLKRKAEKERKMKEEEEENKSILRNICSQLNIPYIE